ncbi:MAG: hypothetical protein HY913_04205 [Desulfomonile tiedjei]|nr:hypothetical protein [Desulfomonile tiedjei]
MKTKFKIDRSLDDNGIRHVQAVLERYLRSNGKSISFTKSVVLIREEFSNPVAEVESLLRSDIIIRGSYLTVEQPNWPEMTGRIRFSLMKTPSRLVGNVTRHAAETLETDLDDHDNEWITEEDAFALLKREFAEMADEEIDNLLYGDALLEGSTLERIDIDGLKMFRNRPAVKRAWEEGDWNGLA